ncbi:MAG: N-acetylmuramoyl-L-alanine amidase [Clostridia bacterium]|nr:N-acetylmuramoyl-L-alanine amidase [Clostridia bacterium]
MSERPQKKILNLKLIVPILLVLTVIISSAAVGIFSLTKSDNNDIPANTSSVVSSPEPDPDPTPTIVEKIRLDDFTSVSLVPGEDILLEETLPEDPMISIRQTLDSIKADGFDSIELTLNYKDGLIFKTELFSAEAGDLLKDIYLYAKSLNLSVITAVDLKALTKKGLADSVELERICAVLSDRNIGSYSDAVLLKNCYILSSEMPEGTSELKLKSVMSMAMRDMYFAVAKADASLYTGVEINDTATPQEAIFNVKQWFNGNFIDFVSVFDPYSTETDDISFMTYFEGWRTELEKTKDVYCKLDYSKIGSGEKGWEKTDQILSQLQVLDTLEVSGLTIDGWNDFANDKTESREAVKKYFANQWADDYVLKDLTVSRPEKKKFTTYDSTVILSGASDPSFKLTLNGKELERTELGYFSLDLTLDLGTNTFVLEHKGVKETYNITYKKLVIKSISPTQKQSLPSRSVLLVGCVALSGSKVTATLGSNTVTLTEEPILDESGQATEYSNFSGRIDLPTVYDEDVSLGKVKFTAKSDFGNETESGGNITIIHEEREKQYEIGEVISWQAETFTSTDNDDYSRPTNNYLPKGTVDYCVGDASSSGGKLKKLRYGNMVYTTSSKGIATLKTYKGTLPDHNELTVQGISNTGRHTQLTLDVLWKAPFKLDLKPQKYTNEGSGNNRDYTISSATFEYVEITFCYATVLNGDFTIPENDPVFKKAEWIKNDKDKSFTLRLYLRRKGMFYGWSAEYNDKGQLVFSFLNPAVITLDSTNPYGYRLDGVIVAIDVGHGGNDVGAVGSHGKYNESQLNLTLAQKIKAQLESLGATVYMTRDNNNENPSSDQRMKLLRDVKADYCIAIHRNASSSSSPRAFNSYHFNAFSADAAKRVNDAIYNYTSEELTAIYNSSNPFHGDGKLYKKTKWSGVKWHYFYTARQTDCPVVLTENGFITNAEEYSDMIRDDFNNECAKALTKGIVDYFVSVQLTDPKPSVPQGGTGSDTSSTESSTDSSTGSTTGSSTESVTESVSTSTAE